MKVPTVFPLYLTCSQNNFAEDQQKHKQANMNNSVISFVVQSRVRLNCPTTRFYTVIITPLTYYYYFSRYYRWGYVTACLSFSKMTQNEQILMEFSGDVLYSRGTSSFKQEQPTVLCNIILLHATTGVSPNMWVLRCFAEVCAVWVLFTIYHCDYL